MASRHRIGVAVRIACALIAALSPFAAQGEYPSRPIRFIVPFPPAGGMDTLGRIFSLHMSESMHQAVVVDNRPGAAGAVGANVAAKAMPDGHTLLMVAGSHAVLRMINPRLPYDPDKDFRPIGALATTEHVLILNNSVPAASVGDLVAVARSRPTGLSYASNGVGGLPHLGMELIGMMTGIKFQHVPYQGAAIALADLGAGQVDAYFATMTSCLSHIRSGRIRAVAISGRQRARLLPQVPTLGESGLPGFETASMYGLLTRSGTPNDIRDRLTAEIVRIQALPEARESMTARGLEVLPAPGDQFGALLQGEADKWSRVLKWSGLSGNG